MTGRQSTEQLPSEPKALMGSQLQGQFPFLPTQSQTLEGAVLRWVNLGTSKAEMQGLTFGGVVLSPGSGSCLGKEEIFPVLASDFSPQQLEG